MRKNLQSKIMLLLAAVLMGVGSAWAAADVTYDFTGSDWSVSNGTLTNGTVSFSGQGTNFKMNSGYFYMGKSGAYINFPTYSSPVEKIVVTGRSGASTSVIQNIFVGDEAVSTATEGATGVNTYVIDSEYQEASTQYTLKVTSGHNTQITKIEVFFVSNATATTLTIDDSGITNHDVYASTAAGTLTATVYAGNTPLTNPAITWSSSNDNVATVNNGVVTLKAAGTTTITASYAGETGKYKASSATYELSVADSTPFEGGDVTFVAGTDKGNTQSTNEDSMSKSVVTISSTSAGLAYSEYRFYKDSETTISTSQGNITNIVFTMNGSYSSSLFSSAIGSYNNGTWTGSANSVTFTASAQARVDKIVVTISMEENNPAAIILEDNLVEVDAGEHDGTINVTYVSLTDFEADVIFCDANGGTVEPNTYDWVDAEIDSNNNLYYTIAANESVAPRTAYMKVYALDDEANDVYSELITITQDAPIVADDPVDEIEIGIGAFVKVTSASELTSGHYLIVYEGESVALNGGLETLDAAFNNIPVVIYQNKIKATEANANASFTIMPNAGTIENASENYIGVTTYANGLKQDKTAETYHNTFSIDNNGNAVITISTSGGDMILNYNYNKNDKRFRYYKGGSQQPIQLYKYDVEAECPATVTVTDAGWATYIAEDNVEFPAAVSAYIATAYNKDNASVTLRKVEAVNQGTPVIVKAEAGTYALETAVVVNNVEDNMLVVYDASTGLEEDYNPFVLAKDDTYGACFKQWTNDNYTALEGRVVLPLPLDLTASTTPSGVRALTIVFSDTTTGIETVGNAVSTMDNGAYTLSGQRVQKPTKGLYIIGGKKVVVK